MNILLRGIIPAYAGSTRKAKCATWGASDHPRIRGEHAGARAYTPSHPGSSPHTRGARHRHPRSARRQRIIPAYAGSTDPAPVSAKGSADHPRIRGEHPRSKSPGGFFHGSSPHTRGAHRPMRPQRPGPGIIPAYAGSTPPTESTTFGFRGSSPHTRGALPRRALVLETGRIIPAYAGSTSPARAGCRVERGSSPHTRGAPTSVPTTWSAIRIIPAYAGSTSSRRRSPGSTADHPRIRGEHRRRARRRVIALGSSPHTRGALGAGGAAARVSGIIPAYAGSTAALASQAHSIADHPRIRGEHTWKSLQYQGSPP